MLWQPQRLTRSPSQLCGLGGGKARLLQHGVVRRLSHHPSIATILATPPTAHGEIITAVGSVRTIRNQKQRSFVEIGDGSTVHPVQALLRPAQAQGLGTGTAVAIRGIWRAAPKGKEQPYELDAEDVEIVGAADPEKYPVQKKYQSAEYLRTIPHLRLRTPFNAALARLKSECDYYLADYFRTRGFVRVQPPIITSSDCEGAGEVFQVSAKAPAEDATERTRGHSHREHFFRDPKFLTVSSQLHLEALIHEHPSVWTLSPTFRAEKSDTPRHVSEFWMLEAELRTDSLDAVMNVVEGMLAMLVNRLQGSTFPQELTAAASKADVGDGDQRPRSQQLQERWNGLTRSPYQRITYSNAIHLLRKATENQEAVFQYEPLWENGLQLEHEKYIAAHVGQGSPVFVTHYPTAVKPFYMLPSTAESRGPSTAECFDLLLPDGTEVVGGSIREHRLDSLARAMYAHGMTGASSKPSLTADSPQETPAVDEGGLGWYLDLRRFGSVPHGGFGLGFDRLIGYLAGVSNIRDVVSWPRYFGRCDG